MPAKNPRLTITLDPTIGAYLRRLSELTGNSQSQLIAELLEDAEPVFARMIQVLGAAEAAREEIKGRITFDIQRAQERIERQLGLAIEEPSDVQTLPLLGEIEKVARRRRKQPAVPNVPSTGGAQACLARAPAASARMETPLSNRGVRSARGAS